MSYLNSPQERGFFLDNQTGFPFFEVGFHAGRTFNTATIHTIRRMGLVENEAPTPVIR